jgi:hypothetical protein
MERRRVRVNADKIPAHIMALNVNVAKPENVKNSALLALLKRRRKKTCALAKGIATVKREDGTPNKRKEKSAR